MALMKSALIPGVEPGLTVGVRAENGEFHSFAYRGPMFDRELPIEKGVVVERGGFVFADVVPAGESSP